MSLKDKKQKVFGEIAASKTLVEGMPLFKLVSSLSSINNQNNPISFLTDLISSLIGQQDLINTVTHVLTHTLEDIEKELKNILKKTLRGIVTCGVNPSIPSFMKSTSTTGITIPVKMIDFMDQFKTDPTSNMGNLMYNNVVSPLTSSNDLNTFLYGVIQAEPTVVSWNFNGNPMLNFQFNSLGSPNNTFTIKTHPNYDGVSLNQLNDNFIDSLKLFDAKAIVNKIIDLIFSSISVNLNKTRKQLEKEAEINDVIDRLSQADVNEEISDCYFKFTNEEVSKQQAVANDRKNGVVRIKTSNEIHTNMSSNFLEDFTNQYQATPTLVQQKIVINNSLNNMANNLASQVPTEEDSQTVKASFVSDIIKNLIKSISSIMLSPKIIVIFLINFKIVNGLSASYSDPIDFIKKNKALFTEVFKGINEMITKELMSIAMKYITQLAGEVALVKTIEKFDNRKQQLLSLVGVPQDALRQIKGLT